MEDNSFKDEEHFSQWTNKEGHVFEHSGQAPSPSKDFCQIVVTPSQVIFRWWKITHRTAETQRLNPGEIKECHEDFLHDDRTQTMIMCAFGQSMVDYVINLCHGHVDYLQRLPDKTIRKILTYVDLVDIAHVALLNKRFHKLCNDDVLWREKFGDATAITSELEALAKEQGWKKLYFSNKLQIQVQLKRKRSEKPNSSASEDNQGKENTLTHKYHDEVLPKH